MSKFKNDLEHILTGARIGAFIEIKIIKKYNIPEKLKRYNIEYDKHKLRGFIVRYYERPVKYILSYLK